MIKYDFKKLLKRYLTDDCTEEERLMVDSWYDLIGEEKDLVSSDLVQLEHKLWNSIQSKTLGTESVDQTHTNPYRIQEKRWHVRYSFQIAASLLFLLTAAWGLFFLTRRVHL